MLGIIPAYAGNTIENNAAKWPNRDHPRICGEHDLIRNLTSYYAGSSPHMRGTLCFLCVRFVLAGIIPAYAGNTVAVRLNPLDCEDHPRICGEHLVYFVDIASDCGSSPHMRGTRIRKC